MCIIIIITIIIIIIITIIKMVSLCLENPTCTSPHKCCYDDGVSRPDGEGVQEITGAVPGREPTPLYLLQVRCPGAHQIEGSVTFRGGCAG